MITLAELEEALKSTGQAITPSEIAQIVKNLDYAGNGKINYSEFLSATIELNRVLT
jgi:calcium-dependent protein kinase